MDLQARYPAVYTDRPHPKVSGQYQFVPTTEVIKLFADHDFEVREMRQMGVRKKDPNFVKHSIRFHQKSAREIGGAVPEILITTAHDTSSGFSARGGMYRPVCDNGMVVGQDIYQLSVPHTGEAKAIITSAIEHMLTHVFPRVYTQVGRWQTIVLEEEHKMRLAQIAMDLRYAKHGTPWYGVEQLLRVRRPVDRGDDLWTVFNVVQENITMGGIPGSTVFTGRNVASRKIEAIGKNIQINAGLWEATERLAQEITNS